MVRNEEGYNISHKIIIHIHTLSSKIISNAPYDGDKHITQRMENWIANPYTVESFNSAEEDDENDGEDNEEDVDDAEDAEDEEDKLATNKGEAYVQGMNYPPRLNNHIRCSSTSSSTPSTDDIVYHGSTPPQLETTDPLIQDVYPPSSTSPSPQAKIVLLMLTHLQKTFIY